MADTEVPAIYCWDGKNKVATPWNAGTDDPSLCPSDANCSVYLSLEQSEQQTPSFKIRFDHLVTKQCQPLIRALFFDSSTPDAATNTLQVSLATAPPASERSTTPSSSCSLILHPPHDASEDELLRYNVTTRNFFAWMAGTSIVGTDPAYALIALKLRMDMWRNPSSDNIAAIRQYAKQQNYTDLPDLHLATECHIRSFVSSAANYTITSVPSSSFSRSSVSAAVRLRQSLGKRAGAMLKRKSEGTSSRESLQLNNSSSQIDLASGTKRPMLSAETPSNSSTDSSTDPGHAGSSTEVLTDSRGRSHQQYSSDMASSSSLSLGNTIPDTLPELPELDDILEPCWLEDDIGDKSKGKGKEREREVLQASYTSSLRQSPSFTESPRAYSNTLTRHSSQRDRRRPQSRAGSGPPSPILEEVDTTRRQYAAIPPDATNKRPRRYSFDTDSEYANRSPRSAHDAVTLHDMQQLSYSTSNLPASSSQFDAARARQDLCTTCKRRKRPRLPTTAEDVVSAPLEPEQPVTTHDKSCIVAVLERVEAEPAQWLNSPLTPKRSQEQGDSSNILRFPSLRGSRSVSRSSSVTAQPTSQPDFCSRSSTLKQAKSAPEPAAMRVRRSTVSEGVHPNLDSANAGVEDTPLSKQRFTPSIRSKISIKRKKSYETVIGIPSGPSEPMSPPRVHKLAPQIQPDGIQSRHEQVELQKQAPTPKPVVPIERFGSRVNVTSPEPTGFPVLMKSNGSRHPLALMAENNNACMIVSTSMPQNRYQPHFSKTRDDTIMLDRLLEGFQFIQPAPEPTSPPRRSKTPSSTIPSINTSLSPGRSSQLSPTSPRTPSSLSIRSSRKSFTSSLRRWRSKDTTALDMYNPSLDDGRMSKNGQIQIRVLTMDSTGKFSTEYVDSPTEMGGFPDFR